MTSKTLVTVIIPTYNGPDLVHGAVTSLLRNQATKGLMDILVINNGHPQSCDFLKGNDQIRVIDTGENLGWEGAIDTGMRNSTSEFVVFFNDDAMIPACSSLWLNQMLQYMRDPKVAAVGPSSNVVMGYQNIFVDLPFQVFESKFLIGFCVLMRRSAFVEIGGMDMSLPGGDDFDWSIRLRDKGYKLVVDRNVFVYHHGFKTGERVHGGPNKPNGWNSYEKTEKINLALIKKHGLKKWYLTMKSASEPPKFDYTETTKDIEGERIRELVSEHDTAILDLGCANNKTVKRAIGIDFIPKGERIPALSGDPISEADIVADVSKDLPVEDNSQDVIIARHILEHMLDPISVLIEWIKKLKKGGRLILALPNQDLMSTIPMNIEHVHAYNPDSIHVLLTGLGLQVLSISDSGNSISFIAVGEKQ